jgi:glycosyltransferase involved in cell wall biosynthesis
MLRAMLKLNEVYPAAARDWTFILAGGSEPGNRYLEELRDLARSSPLPNIEIRVNIPARELSALYEQASIFWHLCGLTHDDPSEVEHFGMTTVEAMERRAVPVVYDGGGLAEIVEHGVDGFRVRTTGEMLEYSLRLIRDPGFAKRLGEAAQAKAGSFSRARFEERVRKFFGRLLEEYASPSRAKRGTPPES